MLAAIATVRAVEVTHAVRDTNVNGHDIKVGDVIAVVDDEITEVGNDYLDVIEAVLAAEPATPELVTVYRGDDVSRGGRGGAGRHAARDASARPSSRSTPGARSTTRTCSPSSDVIHLVTDSTSDISPVGRTGARRQRRAADRALRQRAVPRRRRHRRRRVLHKARAHACAPDDIAAVAGCVRHAVPHAARESRTTRSSVCTSRQS